MMKRILFLVAVIFASPVVGEPSPARIENWREGTALPRTLPDARSVVLNNQIYVMNGVGSQSFFELYDVAADGWRPLTPLPVNLKHFALAAGGGRIYLSGGKGAGGKGADGAGDVWIYAPDAALWIRRAKLPTPRAGHVSVVADGKLFLLGGISDAAGKVQIYDISTGIWDTISAAPPETMPVAVAHSNAVLWGDEIVLVGGVTADGHDAAIVQAFNIKTNRWRRLANLPQAASGVGVAVINDALHVLGGYAQSAQNVLDTHFSLVKNKWRKQISLPHGIHQMATSTTHTKGKSQIVLIGGALGGGFYAVFTASDRVSIYEPTSR
ncbi:MAG: hypothetical protein HAW65_03915 [Alphaproteobacteria bacterium]|nr:hypothetical protein [Alphaproteobacteria bacterium]